MWLFSISRSPWLWDLFDRLSQCACMYLVKNLTFEEGSELMISLSLVYCQPHFIIPWFYFHIYGTHLWSSSIFLFDFFVCIWNLYFSGYKELGELHCTDYHKAWICIKAKYIFRERTLFVTIVRCKVRLKRNRFTIYIISRPIKLVFTL